jgi:hypothetical protein
MHFPGYPDNGALRGGVVHSPAEASIADSDASGTTAGIFPQPRADNRARQLEETWLLLFRELRGPVDTTLLGGLLETLRTNVHRKLERVRVFEAGRCFYRDGERYGQPRRIGGLAFGPALPEQLLEALRKITSDAIGLGKENRRLVQHEPMQIGGLALGRS